MNDYPLPTPCKVRLEPVGLLLRLLITVLLPLALGKTLRSSLPPLRRSCDVRAPSLILVSNVALVLVMWMTFSANADALLQ